jgi:NitT/TauT family transport system substrate-binding protein
VIVFSVDGALSHFQNKQGFFMSVRSALSGCGLLTATSYLMLVLLLSACQSPEPQLRIGTNIWAGYEPLYLARNLGFYKDTQIKLIELSSASDVIHALRSGTLEGAALTLDEALTLIDDGIDLRLILIMDFSDGGDVLLAKPEINSLKALRGKRIAVENSAVGAVLLDGALHAAELTVSDVEIVSCTVNEHIDCYSSVDAVVTFEPVRTKLLQLGAHQLFDSSQIPGRIADVLVVRAETTKTSPQSLEQLLAGYFKANDYLSAQPEDASRRMSRRMGLTPEAVLASYDGIKIQGIEENRRLLQGIPAPFEDTATDLAKMMYGRKLLKNQLTINNFVDGSFMPSNTP